MDSISSNNMCLAASSEKGTGALLNAVRSRKVGTLYMKTLQPFLSFVAVQIYAKVSNADVKFN